MTLFISNKLFSLRGSSVVTDAGGAEVYTIRGKLFSPTRKKFVYDRDGQLLYTVRNKYFHLFTRKALIYDGSGKKILKLVQKWFSIGPKFYTRYYPDELLFDGEFGGFNYTVYCNGLPIATIHRPVLSLADRFQADIADGADHAFFVALVIAVDNILDANKKSGA